MADTGLFCRICRGEATDDQPLLHPCKCRGSIKYIHQECLMEWLKHSNKSTKQCDICNTPYRFRTIYDPNMPDIIPPEYIWDKIRKSMAKSFMKTVSIGLYVVCLIIQVPLFWKFIGRLYTWAIDGKLPNNNNNFFEALLFGEYNIYQYESLNDPVKFKLFKIRKFFDYTFFSGIRYICVFLIIHLALFVEHEWVVRDEGYAKLLLRKIGKEPKSKLVDMFQNALHGLRNDAQNGNQDADDVVNRIEMIANAINDLQEPNNDRRRELELMANLRDNTARLNERQEQQQQPQQPEQGAHEQNGDLMGQEVEQLHRQALENINQTEDDGTDNHIPHEHPVQDNNDVADQEVPGLGGDLFNGGPAENPIVDEAAQDQFDNLMDQARAQDNGNIIDAGQFQDQQQADQVMEEAELENENGNVFELLGLNLNISTPIFLMVMCDIALTIYLFLTYLIPQVLGTVLTNLAGLSITILATLAKTSSFAEKIPLEKWTQTIFTSDGYFVKTGKPLIDFLLFTVSDIVILPTKETLHHLLLQDSELLKHHQPTLVERLITLTLGYSFIGGVIWQFMRMLLRGGKPVRGSARKLYKILFEFSSTIKVFVIFAIEIFFFPVYCGWLLDFCLAPLLLDSFKVNDTTSSPTGKVKYLLLFTSSSDLFTVNYIRMALYWAFGTLYMLFFALFVGMIRGKILRPGVLFFIRSPDDPNARLIHDALVKPLMLQLSRIYLSGKVYTAFILVGIGGVTWGLRYLVHKDQALLPITIYGYSTVFFCGIAIAGLINQKQLISKYCEIYWRKGFEISCHKLRLSHFILGKPIPQERGYVLYRNMLEQFKGMEEPDYTKPVNYREAQRLFDEIPSVNCYFIPDGNYIRVPDNDTVSRKFVKKLFVPVTKDDRLLYSNDGENSGDFLGDHDDEDSSDEEFNNENNHTVVYRPPNLKLRCFQLILMLWVFSVILLLSILLVGLLIGRPFVQVLSLLEHLPLGILNAGAKSSSGIKDHLQTAINQYDWKLADLWSISTGVYVELIMLIYYDRKHQQDGSNEVEPNQQGGPQQANEDQGRLGNLVNLDRVVFGNMSIVQIFALGGLFVVDMLLWLCWIIIAHKCLVDEPAKIYEFGWSERLTKGIETILEEGFIINGFSVTLHLLVGYWTFSPFIKNIFDTAFTNFNNNRNQQEGGQPNQNQNQPQLTVSQVYKNLYLKTNFLRLIGILFISFAWNFTRIRMNKQGKNPVGNVLSDVILIGVACLLCIVVDVIGRAKKLLQEYIIQVKNERYVRGRALENLED